LRLVFLFFFSSHSPSPKSFRPVLSTTSLSSFGLLGRF
jgi:hypothetical protein